jgi:hypothetical protein
MIVAIASDETKKKRVERAYVEEARRASSVIPYGDLVAHENPDFLLYADDRTIGLEVTELCRENPRAEGAMLARVADRAKDRYNALAPNEPVEVSASFAPRMQERRLGLLVTGLVSRFLGFSLRAGCHRAAHAPIGHALGGATAARTSRWIA